MEKENGKGRSTGFLADYPKCVFFILGNEFCERFSYYGMRAILVIYLTEALNYSESGASAVYHAFIFTCYFMPLFGAMIADGLLGKYRTILYISVIYAIGNVVMSLTSFPNNPSNAGCIVGLLLIAVGTGGIKPCVGAFGGDQFKEHQRKQQDTFFSIFYMAINVGSLLSMIITPILRTSVKCFGKDCYPVAFGVPAGLMLLALLSFLLGTKWYENHPPSGNVIGKMIKCVGVAIRGRCRSKEKNREHWLDYADEVYPAEFVGDVKAVLKVLFLFLPVPVFWALFDQMGSRWTLQAGQMNGRMGTITLQQEQMQAVNAIFVIILVPITESLLFPCLDKLRVPNRPLQRLGAGMFFAATAFIITGVVQIAIDNTQPAPIEAGLSNVKFINSAPCDVTIQSTIYNGSIDVYKASTKMNVLSGTTRVKVTPGPACNATEASADVPLNSTLTYSIIIAKIHDQIKIREFYQNETSRPGKSRAMVRVVNTLPQLISFRIHGADGQDGKDLPNITSFQASSYVSLKQGRYNLMVGLNGSYTKQEDLVPDTGSVRTIAIQADTNGRITLRHHTDISANEIHMMMQLPQYFVMTFGECLFSITGLSFSYSQAPASMKTVVQAAWLLTSAFGNVLVVLVVEGIRMSSQALEFFVFAILMYVTMVLFGAMSMRYKYVDNKPTITVVENGIDNKSFIDSCEHNDIELRQEVYANPGTICEKRPAYHATDL